MVLGLFLALIAALVGYVLHAARVDALERRHTARTAEQIRTVTAERSRACRELDRMAALDRAKSCVIVGSITELRTPLTLIKAPLEMARRSDGSLQLEAAHVQTIMHQINRLNRGLDQLRDVIEVELDGGRTAPRPSDLVEVVEKYVTSLRPAAERSGVTIQFHSDEDSLEFSFDRSRITRVLRALVENAFENTDAGDTIQFLLTVRSAEGLAQAVLEMSDNGHPMADAHLALLTRKQDAEFSEQSIADASALKLALARKFVELQGGELQAERTGLRGSRVRIILPITVEPQNGAPSTVDGPAVEDPESLAGTPDDVAVPAGEAEDAMAAVTEEEKPATVLVVDDHEGTRGYLSYALRKHHRVVEAVNGEQALAMIREQHPELVISDVMMPVMDGNELCRTLKNDPELNHIPIFLVTANVAEAVRKEGLESGADDYLLKPFDLDEAVMRIDNEIRTRRQLRQRFSREVVIKPSDITVTPADEAFLNRAREIVEERMEDTNFGVQELASEVGLSPRHLQRRLRELLDQSPVEFIRTLRLQRAAQLLQAQYGNVSEVAYPVGFTSLSYFSKCFREQFGVSPSEYRAEQST